MLFWFLSWQSTSIEILIYSIRYQYSDIKDSFWSDRQLIRCVITTIAKIEEYRIVCEKANKITYADKVYLIKAAEKLFFDDDIVDLNDRVNWSTQDKPQMFTDPASINRSLLDN